MQKYIFSGIVYRICGVAGVVFLCGILILLTELYISKKKRTKIRNKRLRNVIICVVGSVVLTLVYSWYIFFPRVEVHTGEFVDSHRNSRVAPPLPFTREYVFTNEDGKNEVFFLDVFSEKKLIENGFQEEREYTIYYEARTKVIVGVETN